MFEPKVFFPEQKVFVLRPTLIAAGIATSLAALFTILMIADPEDRGLVAFLPAGMALAFSAYTFIDRKVAFSKTRYEIHHDRVVHISGGILSDHTTNLPFRNVTQFEMTLPFLEYRFYKTGHVAVHAAGSSSGNVRFTSVANPEELYQVLEDSLRRNGFSLERKELIQQEAPGLIGVFLDGNVTGSIVGVLLPFAFVIPIFVNLGDDLTFLLIVGFLVLFLAFLATAAYAVLSFIDRKERVYTLWNDCIEYEDGFLTRHRKIIPFANLADTHAEEKFLKRIFGMSDVVISCQGSSGDIHFPSMPRANLFRANLDRLLSQASPLAPPDPQETPGATPAAPGAPGEVRTPAFSPVILGASDRPGRTYRISPVRYAAPYLVVLPLLVLGLPIMQFVANQTGNDSTLADGAMLIGTVAISAIAFLAVAGHTAFAWFTQRFTLGPRSVSFTQEFITQKNTTEFTNDKVTSITIHRTFLDRIFKTTSISFFSIGAKDPIKFKILPDYQGVLQELHDRFGLPDAEPHQEIASKPTLTSLLTADLLFFAFLAVCAVAVAIVPPLLELPSILAAAGLALILLVAIGSVVHGMLYHSRSRLSFFEHHLMVRKGLINREFTYIAYHDARNIVATQYPAHDLGRLVIDVGGAAAKTDIEQIPTPFALQDHLDSILYQRPMRDVSQTSTFDTDILASWKPEAKNAHLSNSFALTLVIVGIPLIPFNFLYDRAYYKKAEDHLQVDRICKHRGLFFKRRNTVLINRIDQIQTYRGALHNLCKNGIVKVYTVGSGNADIVLGPHPDFQQIYNAIEQRIS